MEPGLRTGHYRISTDELLIDHDGGSYVSMEDMAVAILDDTEHPAHRRQRRQMSNPPRTASKARGPRTPAPSRTRYSRLIKLPLLPVHEYRGSGPRTRRPESGPCP